MVIQKKIEENSMGVTVSLPSREYINYQSSIVLQSLALEYISYSYSFLKESRREGIIALFQWLYFPL